MTASAPWPRLDRELVAILRGITFDRVDPLVNGLIEAGFRAIEIPLNSPDPFRSIEMAARIAPADCLIGAGTVVDPADVDRLDDAGGRLLVSPNADPQVLARAGGYAMVTMPGVFTATEAFVALKAGASALKFFPASSLGPGGIAAIATVLPKGTVIGAVGGVSDGDFAAYRAAGITAFGLGSSLFKPAYSNDDVLRRAKLSISAYDKAVAEQS